MWNHLLKLLGILTSRTNHYGQLLNEVNFKVGCIKVSHFNENLLLEVHSKMCEKTKLLPWLSISVQLYMSVRNA